MLTGYGVRQSVLSSAARTISGSSSWYNVKEFSRVTFYIDVTAVAGTNPLMTLKLQESPDQSAVFTVDQIDAAEVDTYRLTTDEHTMYVRLRYELAGTSPSFTFSAELVMRS